MWQSCGWWQSKKSLPPWLLVVEEEKANFLLRCTVNVSLQLPISNLQHQEQGRRGSSIQQLCVLWGVRMTWPIRVGLMFISPGTSIVFTFLKKFLTWEFCPAHQVFFHLSGRKCHSFSPSWIPAALFLYL